VQLANSVSLDFAHDHGRPHAPHYAFIVTEQEFDEIPGRIIERSITYRRRGGLPNSGDTALAQGAAAP
jgi:hypothetical protein